MSISLLALILIALYILREPLRWWIRTAQKQSKSSCLRIELDIAKADAVTYEKIKAMDNIPNQDEMFMFLEGKRTSEETKVTTTTKSK